MIDNSRRITNPNALMLAFATLLGVMLSMGLVYSVLTTRGNSLSHLTLFIAIAGFAGGIINPRLMLFIFVIATGYLDLLKRLLVLFDNPNMLDLYFVMGVAPLMMLGILCGVVLGGMLGRYSIDKRHWRLFFIATAFVLITAAFAFRNAGIVLGVKRISNGAAYAYLLFVLPVLFRSWQELWVLCRFVLFAFIPVGLYAIYQSIFGISAFELEYLQSGLTIMVKELRDVKPRPFSTMNAQHTMAYMAAILMAFSYLPFAAGKEFRNKFRHRWIYGLLIVFYFIVCFVTLVRSGHFLWMAAFAGIFAFYSAKRAAFFYGAAVSAFLLMMTFSDWILKKLPVWDAMLDKSNDFMFQATRIQTFKERIYSYAQLKEWENYSLFGLKHQIAYHDAITEALARYGVVPLAIGIGLIVVRLSKIHKAIGKVVSVGNRRVTCLFLAVVVAIVACDAFFGSTAKVYPISAYMWFAISGALIVVYYQSDEQPSTQIQPTVSEPKPVKAKSSPVRSPLPAIVPSGIPSASLSINSSSTAKAFRP